MELEGTTLFYYVRCCSFKLLQQIWINMNFKGYRAGLNKQNILINFYYKRLLDGVKYSIKMAHYPCGVCEKSIDDSKQSSIFCDLCNSRVHT